MPAPAAEKEAPALVLSRGVKVRWLLLAGTAALLLFLLLVGLEVGIRQVAPDAVQVTVSVAATGHTLASRAIADPRLASDLYARINRLPWAGPASVYHCGLSGPDPVTFAYRFTRWSLPVEVATLPVCGGWEVIRGGLTDVRDDPNGESRVIQDEVQPLGCPQPWGPRCDGY
jgi:hypothetical protein